MPNLYGDLGMITVKKHGMRIMKNKKKTNKRRMKRHGSKLRMKKGSAEGSDLWIQVRLILLKQGRKASGDILCEFKQLTDAELIDDVAHVVEFSTGYISATIFLSPMVVRPAHHDGRDVEEMWRAGLVLS
eukprot:s5704_g6.t2